jgi:hypothetical protein
MVKPSNKIPDVVVDTAILITTQLKLSKIDILVDTKLNYREI